MKVDFSHQGELTMESLSRPSFFGVTNCFLVAMVMSCSSATTTLVSRLYANWSATTLPWYCGGVEKSQFDE